MAAADGVTLYTRGQPGDADTRGESLVQQHLDRMQQQKETVAMDKLRLLVPQMGDKVRALALAKTEWDIDAAVAMLRRFQVAHLDKLNGINKKRKKIREAMEGSGDDEPGAASSSSSESSSSSSDSDNGDEQERKRRKRSASGDRDKARGEERGKSRKRSSKKESRHKRSKDKRSSKRDKKEKKDKRRSRSRRRDEDEDARRKLTHGENFAKHGYLREDNFSSKQSEFMVWATEVKGVNIELLGRAEEKELQRDFMEDFNTSTLPEKYYDLMAWERTQARKAAAEAAKSAKKPAAGAAFDARADEEALRRKRAEERLKFQQDRLAEAYNLLKHTDRAKDMREQELLRAEMALAYKTGDKERAQKLFDRLQPDEEKKKR